MHSIYPVHAHTRVSFIVPINLFRQDASDFNGFLKIIFQMIRKRRSALNKELSITLIPTWKKPMELSTLVMKTVQGKLNEADDDLV